MNNLQKIVVLCVVGGIILIGGFFLLNNYIYEEKQIDKREVEVIEESIQALDEIIIKNQGSTMEGHTPRGFQGMGTGLFAGDNLNPNFPNGDGVQIFITFDLEEIAQRNITSVLLQSKHAHINGSPFDLGVLQAESVRYGSFSSALWNLKSEQGFTCAFANSPEGPYECDVTEVIEDSIRDGYQYAQFRLLFDKAGNNDGTQDLLMFYITNTNTNEPGIFELVIE